MVWFRREMGKDYSVIKHIAVPIVAIVGAGAALIGSILPSFDAAAPALTRAMPYVAVAWIVVGVLYIAYLQSAKPGLVAKIGRDLSEMDAPPEPVDVRFGHDASAAD
jgi:hypothetical protein